MKTMVFLTPADAGFGFTLGGVRQLVTTREALPEHVLALAADQTIGVIAVDERLLDRPLIDERLRAAQRRWPGLVVVLPAPAAVAVPEDDYALRLIRQAIGYHVRVNL